MKNSRNNNIILGFSIWFYVFGFSYSNGLIIKDKLYFRWEESAWIISWMEKLQKWSLANFFFCIFWDVTLITLPSKKFLKLLPTKKPPTKKPQKLTQWKNFQKVLHFLKREGLPIIVKILTIPFTTWKQEVKFTHQFQNNDFPKKRSRNKFSTLSKKMI